MINNYLVRDSNASCAVSIGDRSGFDNAHSGVGGLDIWKHIKFYIEDEINPL